MRELMYDDFIRARNWLREHGAAVPDGPIKIDPNAEPDRWLARLLDEMEGETIAESMGTLTYKDRL